MSRLYYGDNLDVLREHIKTESVDLVYLDPPFNSKRDYNLFFSTPTGSRSEAQNEAFKDTWSWGEQSEREFHEILNQQNTQVSSMLESFRRFLNESDLMAYLTMMAVRLVELHRVLRTDGSLYLHCDPAASHYLKILLDAVFGHDNFRNEITWKRQSAHSDAKHKFSDVTDTILFYAKSKQTLFKPQYGEHDEDYIKRFYRFNDNDGRGLYRLGDMASPNPRPNMMYDYKGFSYPQKGWRYQLRAMKKLDEEGRIHFPQLSDGQLDLTKRLALKRYLNEQKGSIITNVWTDLNSLHSSSNEFLGYPTQKPLSLLERIIQASSNEGDVVLDPFCGCGTAVHAAQKLGRDWIGIDITHLAISLIEKRLLDAFPGLEFTVEGTPKDIEAARDLANRDKYQFQWWACSLVNCLPFQGKKKGADGGIDGISYFVDADLSTGKPIHRKAITSVKGGKNVSLTMLKDLIATVESNQADIGLFVTLTEPTEPMNKEALKAGFFSPNFNEQIKISKIQILTIEGLLSQTQQPQIPDMSQGGLNFKKAQQEAPKHDQKKLF